MSRGQKLHPIDEQLMRAYPELARFAEILAKYPPSPELKATVRGPDAYQVFQDRQAARAQSVQAARRRARRPPGAPGGGT